MRRRGRGAFAMLALVCITILAGACGGSDSSILTSTGSGNEDASEPTVVPETTTAEPAPLDATYCQALENMVRSQPAGSLSDAEFAEAMAAYIEGIEGLIEVSTVADAEVLRQLVEVMELTAADPSSPEIAAMMSDVGGPLAAITLPATRDCGIDFDG